MSKKKPRAKSSRPEATISPAKKRAFFAIVALIPLLLFTALEIILRLLSYGPNLDLFTTETIAGKKYHIMNHDVKNRYFTHVEFSPNTSPDYFLVPKPQGTYRIFCLGGSTTVGYPYGYAGSFSSCLRDRLHLLFPEKPVEVINLGMTATNSFTVNDVTEEIFRYEPDLIIVYDGHNEFYGALGVASHESIGGARWLTRLYLKMVHIKTFLLVRNAVRGAAALFSPASSAPEQGTMMERLARGKTIPLGSPLYKRGMDYFRENLETLREMCAREGVPCILSTQVSNFRDQAPFVSYEENDPQAHRFDDLLNRIPALMSHDSSATAMALLKDARRLDSSRADIEYAIGRCFQAAGRYDQARLHYLKARDLDMLRFRAGSDANRIIREACDGSTTLLADVEAAFLSSAPDSLIGINFILEHLHPNASGYFLIGKEYARVMKGHGLVAPPGEWAKRDTVSDEVIRASSPLTTLDFRCAGLRTFILTSGWPFQPGGRQPSSVPPGDRIGEIVDRMVSGRITWEEGHVGAAEYYAEDGEPERAVNEYKAIINQIPVNVSAYLRLGQIYIRLSKSGEASDVLQRSLAVEPTAIAFRMLGTIEMDRNKAYDAISWFSQGMRIAAEGKEKNELGYLLASAHIKNGEREAAIGELRRVLLSSPDFKPARALLQRLSSVSGNH